MASSTREASVMWLCRQVARHRLYEKEGSHQVRAEPRGRYTMLSVTCDCGRNWYLLPGDVEPRLHQLFDWNQEAKIISILNVASGSWRRILRQLAPSLLNPKYSSRYDRDPPV